MGLAFLPLTMSYGSCGINNACLCGKCFLKLTKLRNEKVWNQVDVVPITSEVRTGALVKMRSFKMSKCYMRLHLHMHSCICRKGT